MRPMKLSQISCAVSGVRTIRHVKGLSITLDGNVVEQLNESAAVVGSPRDWTSLCVGAQCNEHRSDEDCELFHIGAHSYLTETAQKPNVPQRFAPAVYRHGV